jgi:hypothetical protein
MPQNRSPVPSFGYKEGHIGMSGNETRIHCRESALSLPGKLREPRISDICPSADRCYLAVTEAGIPKFMGLHCMNSL